MRFLHPFALPPAYAYCAASAFAFALLAGPTAPALAAPLDKTACAKLAQDMQNMKALEVDKLMEKGPAWAVSHLSSGDLSLVRQYIDLDEQMRFRCSAPGSLVHLKHLEDDDDEGAPKAAADNGVDKDQGAAKESESPSSQPKQKATKAPKKAKQPGPASSGDAH
jgi:hypothetical protein